MKTLDECLFEFVTGQPAVQALIDTRLFPDFFAQNERLPAVAYALEDDQSYETQQGPSALRKAIYRFGVWDITAKSAMQVAEAIRQALDGYKGPMGDRNYVVAIFDRMHRSRDPETMAFNVDMRFLIFYQQPKSN